MAPVPATALRGTGPLRSLRKACALSCASPSTAESGLNLPRWFQTLPHNLPRRFIFPQPDKLRVPQVTIWRPFGELDLDDPVTKILSLA